MLIIKNIDDHLNKIVKFLKEGKVVVHPTETCYGLAVDIFQPEAVKALYALKGRDAAKPVSMMVRDLAEAEKYAEFHLQAIELAEKFWPGPLTLVLKRKETLPKFFNPEHETIGIRCPDSVLAQALLKEFNGPLSTTSANVSGQSEVYRIEDFLAQFGGQNLENILILDGGILPKNSPSTIVGFEGSQPIILREGSMIQALKAFC